jgi:hypothetical protein
MTKHIIHIGAMHLVIDVELFTDDVWVASTLYRDERLAARSHTRQEATSALIAALNSEISRPK